MNELLDEMTITHDFSNDQERFALIKNLNDSSLEVYDKIELMQKLLHFNKELYEAHEAHAESSEIYNKKVDKDVTGAFCCFSVINIFICAVEVDDITLFDLREEEDCDDYWMEIEQGMGAWVENEFLDLDEWSKIQDKKW